MRDSFPALNPGEVTVTVLKVFEAYALHFSLSDFSLYTSFRTLTVVGFKNVGIAWGSSVFESDRWSES